jgi:hypothetical protein
MRNIKNKENGELLSSLHKNNHKPKPKQSRTKEIIEHAFSTSNSLIGARTRDNV